MLNYFKFHRIIHNTTSSTHRQVSCTRKNNHGLTA